MDGIAQNLIAGLDLEADQPAQTARDLAFAALVDRHAKFLYRVAFGLLRNAEDAEDAVQDTFLKLWRAGLDRRGTAGAIAMKNSQDVTELEIAGQEDSPEQTAIANSDRALLRTLIEALPESLRQPLVLTHIDGMKSQEVAAILGIPDGTVRSRINTAKAELHKKFLAARPARRGEAL